MPEQITSNSVANLKEDNFSTKVNFDDPLPFPCDTLPFTRCGVKEQFSGQYILLKLPKAFPVRVSFALMSQEEVLPCPFNTVNPLSRVHEPVKLHQANGYPPIHTV